ncbi:hypothetical protein [Lysobacter gummosus]|uniref:hypothetical protein n=1 Tax=Lysobacter gummosus TaxID=262324 RepID=UPI0036367773
MAVRRRFRCWRGWVWSWLCGRISLCMVGVERVVRAVTPEAAGRKQHKPRPRILPFTWSNAPAHERVLPSYRCLMRRS